MNISVTWTVVLAGPARKSLERIAGADQERLHTALKEMGANPFRGDVKYLRGQKRKLRRRVGNWRIFFHLDPEQKHLVVTAIERRSSTTY